KVSIAYRAGFKAVGSLVYAWPDALDKAKLADRVLRERLDRLGLRFDQILTEFVGYSSTHGALVERDLGEHARTLARELPEVQLRFGVRGNDKSQIERFTREIAPLVLNGPPSVTGFAGGRPKVEEIVAYWPALIDKTTVTTTVDII
ncbi:MAG: acyclic terpene utilization AtuA family protein, partial [Gemmatimonadaceae bacterium]